jgi:tetratricopeptide (TPR) repeat protein
VEGVLMDLAACPYCNRKLEKTPGRKKACPHCGNYIYVRTRPNDFIKILVTKQDADTIQKQWNLLNQTMSNVQVTREEITMDSLLNNTKDEDRMPHNYHYSDAQFNKATTRNLQGISFEQQGRIDEAIDLYEQNVSLKFDGSHPYTRLAIIYRRRKQYDDEIRVIEKAISVFDKQNAPKDLEYFSKRLLKAKKLQEKTQYGKN